MYSCNNHEDNPDNDGWPISRFYGHIVDSSNSSNFKVIPNAFIGIRKNALDTSIFLGDSISLDSSFYLYFSYSDFDGHYLFVYYDCDSIPFNCNQIIVYKSGYKVWIKDNNDTISCSHTRRLYLDIFMTPK